MKIENEVTGEIVVRNASYIRVEIYLRGEKIDRFGIYLNGEGIEDYLEHNTDKFLGVENTYDGYAQLVKDLGLEIPESYKKHWIPSPYEKYFCIDSTGEVYKFSYYDEVSCGANKRIKIYNAFPTRELAEKSVNLSKLGRLILLWQYANDCVHTPYWSSTTKNNFCLSLDIASDKIGVVGAYLFKRDCIYFKTRKQAEAFVKMYEKEIIRLMSIK